jgi:hypothetical protein
MSSKRLSRSSRNAFCFSTLSSMLQVTVCISSVMISPVASSKELLIGLPCCHSFEEGFMVIVVFF